MVRWLVYVALVLFGTVVVYLRDSGGDSLYRVLFGASAEGVSIIEWSYVVVVWIGLTQVFMLNWSELLTERLPYVVLRYGRTSSWLLRQLARNAGAAELVSVGLLGLIAGLDVVFQGSISWQLDSVLQLLLVAPVAVMVVLLLSLIAIWLFGTTTAGLVVQGVAVVISMPLLNPVWPWPVAMGFQGARATESATVWPLLVGSLGLLVGCLLELLVLARRRPLDFI